MAAHGAKTVTIDTSEMVYVDFLGNPHTVTNGQTFTVFLAARGSVELWKVSDDTLLCTSGATIRIDIDDAKTQFTSAADGAAKLNAGSIWFYENDGRHVEWKIRTITLSDIDGGGAGTITAGVLERVDNPMITMLWPNTGAGITVGA